MQRGYEATEDPYVLVEILTDYRNTALAALRPRRNARGRLAYRYPRVPDGKSLRLEE